MEGYLEEVHKMEKRFQGLEMQHVPRGTNKEADTSPSEPPGGSPKG